MQVRGAAEKAGGGPIVAMGGANPFLGVLFCVLAYFGNVLNADLVFGVNFLFGSIFVWLAMMIVGPLWAIAAAVLAALHTVELWGHWYAAGLFTLEAVLVSCAHRRSLPTRVTAYVLLYWLLLGIPSSILAYSQGLGLPWTTVTLVVSKQVLNSLVNVAFAVFLFNLILLVASNRIACNGGKATSSYSNFLQALFGLSMLLPISVSEFVELHQSFKNQTGQVQERALANVERSAINSLSFLKLETAFWTRFFHGVEGVVGEADLVVDDTRSHSVLPQVVFEMSPSGGLSQRFGLFDAGLEALQDFVAHHPIPKSQGTHLCGCWSGLVFTISNSVAPQEVLVFGWRPADLGMLVSEVPGTDVEIHCDAVEKYDADTRGSRPSVEIVRDMSVGVPALSSWQRGYVLSEAPLSAEHPARLRLVIPLKSTILALQQDTARAVVRLCILAVLIVGGGLLLEAIFRRWVEHFVLTAETFLRFHRSPPGRINTNFYEEREIAKWLGRFAKAVESEERRKILAVENLKKLVRQTSIPIFATDLQGNVAEWNPALEKMTGFSRDETIGTPLRALAESVHDSEMGRDGFEGALFNIDIRSKNGSLVHLEASQTLLTEFTEIVWDGDHQRTAGQGVIKFFMARSLNDLKATQAKLVEASRLAALGEMASSFAHELNQPLNIISMSAGNYLERIKWEDVPSTYVISKMRRIEQQALRAGRVIQGIRQFVLEIGDEEIVPFDPAERIEAAIALLHEQLRLDSVGVELDLPVSRVSLVGRPILFEQTIVNLLTNSRHAMQCMPRQERCIRIQIVSHDTHIVVSVQDSGPGISPELIDRVFDPFFTTKEDANGTGIGLYLSKTVVEAMHGSIHADAVQKGARIVMQFPHGGSD
ncbi:ATP-binding protein [Shimia sp. CNT1-13L.2]|uniref:PAS domain-containing sensor histidine kinase n=1 Tax=Shimia sp. CNT1-13L.2 TaxID=2959663 RepID=UPI0020CEF620|nr:ATP-binding protein [Shimia sp. CNT1-13L.2]MCP9483366.1 ATP-binding protein [Shimia sp. CNT1-13L.2]